MTSQVCKIPASEMSIGDVVYGVDETEWMVHYELVTKNIPSGSYCRYKVKKVHPQEGIELLDWSPPLSATIWVKNKIFKYDPRQAGDTDEDI